MTAIIRHAACGCGQLQVACRSEPVRISMCHCLECQRRTGSVFGNSAWFPREDVSVAGEVTEYRRPGDSGAWATFRFCPKCGSTVWWQADIAPERIAVAVGCFADPDFPPPRHSVYEGRRHGWTTRVSELDMEHWG
jgi:hypothetical protein